MNQQSQTAQATKPISDDQELAKVLAGIPKDSNDLSFGDNTVQMAPTPMPTAQGQINPQTQDMPDPLAPSMPPMPETVRTEEPMAYGNDFKLPEMPPIPVEPAEIKMPETPPTPIMPDFAKNLANNQLGGNVGARNSQDLELIRKDALLELRPLVEKLDLAAEEKFDIYLLLLRSTDDTTLIAPAHEAAKNIADDTKRAEALLDVIKEIDFLSRPADTIE